MNEYRGVFVHQWAMKDCDGNPRDAMVWAQITWLLQPAQRDGSHRGMLIEQDNRPWLCITDDDLAEQLVMTRDQVHRARLALKKRGLIDCRRSTVDGRKSLIALVGSARNRADQPQKSTQIRSEIYADSRSSPFIEAVKPSFGESEDSPSEEKEIPVVYDGKGEPPSVEAVRLRREPFPPQFLRAWELYPKEGDHDRLGAYKAWRARVVEAPKAGVGRVARMENLLLAVRGYALECDDLDRADEFIKNAATFFGAANESVMKHCIRVARDRCGSATVAS